MPCLRELVEGSGWSSPLNLASDTVNSAYQRGAGDAGPHAVTSVTGRTYAYDDGGNQVSRSAGGQTTALAYDIQNRLVEMSGAGADMGALYDASGNRVKRTIDGDVTFYVGGNYEVAEGAGGGGGAATTTDDAVRFAL